MPEFNLDVNISRPTMSPGLLATIAFLRDSNHKEESEFTPSTMQVSPVFNPNGNDNIANRTIWFGETTNLMQLNDVRYSWAVSLYRQMREQFWIPEKIDLTQDVNDYSGNLTPAERRAFDGILSYLTFLDSIQTCNVPHLKACVTAPEVAMCMAEQISQEAMHNQSYQYIIETIIPGDHRTHVYDFWRTDEVLKQRCEFIANMYQDFVSEPTRENYFIALVADYLLEGLYFYNGFNFFYNLSSRMLMPQCADIFRMINRDELSHLRLYQKLVTEAIDVFECDTDIIYKMFSAAVEHEIAWTDHIIGNDILGISRESTEQYCKYLANVRLRAIGLEQLYPEKIYKKNPYAHLERFSDTKSEGTTKANFFEATVTTYAMSSSIGGWDDF